MSEFKLSIEQLREEKVKIVVELGEQVDATDLCEVLFTACHTLSQTHSNLLKTLFYCCLQVLKEDQQIMNQVKEILKTGNSSLVSN